ncbi:2-acylglycerol O-acyltransferase 1-like [Chrysoperla carnea]|uniref:2-acylglycerol O-acyltransferase 1-like n=1 Tax=Chrysoperla carnea TaxID=189513 RepID=UPI001D09587B|nr:2-acylglycerol O-acyltransferase 1-like [Chrysoperla carnea]
MYKIFGIEFAPINIPLERRLQTIAAAFWLFSCVGFNFLFCGIGLFMLTTKYYWIIILYGFWYYYDLDCGENGGRSSKWCRNWTIWSYFRDYFPIKLVKLDECVVDPKRNYMFCYHPHGVLATGFFGSFATDVCGFPELFPGFKSHPLTLDSHFKTPFFRDYVLALGACTSSKKSINCILSKPEGGNIVALAVGGAEESFYCRPGEYKIILKKRKGFIRLALRNGAPLVPVFSFGETDIYSQVSNPDGSLLRWLQNQFKNLTGIAPIIPIGRGFFQYNVGLVPKRHPITVVVGKPIDVVRVDEPTTELVDEYHAKFTKALIELFETEKYKYADNPEKTKLIII